MGFEGAWNVREYVAATDGSLAGVVAQRRHLERHEDRIRVIQDCTPGDGLRDHPMGAFAGRHVFDLVIDGGHRRYLGPAVIGTGFDLGSGAMIGRGLWPEFGHAFTSYAILIAEDRQLTGGTFQRAGAISASIVGVAEPDDGRPPPSLDGPTWPSSVAPSWEGTRRTIALDGRTLDERPVRRTYREGAFAEDDGLLALHAEIAPATHLVRGTAEGRAMRGFARKILHRIDLELVYDDHVVESTELFDPKSRVIAAIRRIHRGPVLERFEVLRLAPIEPS
jgi:hypothetical protein